MHPVIGSYTENILLSKGSQLPGEWELVWVFIKGLPLLLTCGLQTQESVNCRLQCKLEAAQCNTKEGRER